jgi:hypothetical protein
MWISHGSWFQSDRCNKIFILQIVHAECGTNWYPIQWVQVAFSPGVKRLDRQAIHSPSSVMRLRMTGHVPPLRRLPSWRIQSKIHLLRKHWRFDDLETETQTWKTKIQWNDLGDQFGRTPLKQGAARIEINLLKHQYYRTTWVHA